MGTPLLFTWGTVLWFLNVFVCGNITSRLVRGLNLYIYYRFLRFFGLFFLKTLYIPSKGSLKCLKVTLQTGALEPLFLSLDFPCHPYPCPSTETWFSEHSCLPTIDAFCSPPLILAKMGHKVKKFWLFSNVV